MRTRKVGNECFFELPLHFLKLCDVIALTVYSLEVVFNLRGFGNWRTQEVCHVWLHELFHVSRYTYSRVSTLIVFSYPPMFSVPSGQEKEVKWEKSNRHSESNKKCLKYFSTLEQIFFTFFYLLNYPTTFIWWKTF